MSRVTIFKNVALIALLYALLFNTAHVIFKFEYYKIYIFKAVSELTKDFIQNYIALFVIFCGLAVSRLLFITGSVFLFFTGAAASYYLFWFKVVPTKQIIYLIFDNPADDAMELINLKVIFWCVFSIIISLYISTRKYTQNKRTRVVCLMCLLLTAYNIYFPKYKLLKNYFPIQYLHNAYLFFSEKINKPDKFDIASNFKFIDESAEDLVVVLVIGESARFDHLSINGYERDTTPLIKQIPNLYSFKALSCGNLTHVSVDCMLTRATSKNIDSMYTKETTFLSAFSKLGFETIWVGLQSITKFYDKKAQQNIFYNEANIAILPGGSIVVTPHGLDETMLPFLDDFLTKPKKKLIVLHTVGSHWDYGCRYPKSFEKFSPICNKKVVSKRDQTDCEVNELVNMYDNSIYYTDYFLSEVIKRLKNKNAIMFYASDHGESLGENGLFGHGGSLPHDHVQYQIPFIVWGSDKFINENKEAWEAVIANSKNEISHDYLFHSILDCSKIKSDIIDSALSLCRKK